MWPHMSTGRAGGFRGPHSLVSCVCWFDSEILLLVTRLFRFDICWLHVIYGNTASGTHYPEPARGPYPPAPYGGPTCEPPLPNHRWGFPPQTVNHREFTAHRPPSRGPIPVATRGLCLLPTSSLGELEILLLCAIWSFISCLAQFCGN